MSSGGSAPSSTTQTQELPAWAEPYAKGVLAQGSALTDINQNPYQQYSGDRIAGFSDLQNQSFNNASNLGYNPVGQQFNSANAQQYMSPYIDASLAPQLRAAANAGMMASNMDSAKAVGQGAFGGTRGALQQSLTQKNTLQNLSDITGQGYNTAFNNAQNQFNQQQARNIQEAQFGSQYGMDVNKLQNQYGLQQQQQAQKPLDMAYQDFLNQKNYPYKQLGFMSDLVRGLPVGSTTSSQVYNAAPNPLATLGGLGLTGKGLGLYKKGGAVKNKKTAGLAQLAMNKIMEK
jgi:2',3'-cyclic-nucleotide 2'-phosphodiesterase (5'-nucleotidase family)